jgi:TetR/AcrR family transcriptional regulator
VSEITPQPTDSTERSESGSGTAARILDAAEELFAEHGFAGAAVRDIATRAGLNAGSLYNHFESKQALYEAVLERGLRPVYEMIEGVTDPEVAPDHRVLEALTTHLSASPDLARLIQHETLAGGDHAMRIVRRWLDPVYARASIALERSPGLEHWDREELPLLLMTYHHLIFGHFALARSLGQVLDVDLLSPEAVLRHTRFLEKVTERLLGAPGNAAGTEPGDLQ